jgi:hypothetical protein
MRVAGLKNSFFFTDEKPFPFAAVLLSVGLLSASSQVLAFMFVRLLLVSSNTYRDARKC